jgi:type II secretory pathway pseudopilin PulG
VLLAVVAMLVMSYATSFKAYLQQRDQIRTLQAQIAQRQAEITALQKEKARWHDPAYVRAQARERLMYVMPGETGFQVIGRDGQPLDPVDALPASSAASDGPGQGWWNTAWQSVVIAGRSTDSVLGGTN